MPYRCCITAVLCFVMANGCSGAQATSGDGSIADLDAGMRDGSVADATVADGSAHDAAGSDAGACTLALPADTHAADRHACMFAAGAHPSATLGISAAEAAMIPIDHIIIVTEENRSFDHYFATFQGDLSSPLPSTYRNTDMAGAAVAPHHLTSHCLPEDPPHQWAGEHAGWNNGAMDGWVANAATSTSNGHYAIGYYDETDLPFYHWLAHTFAFSDRHHCDSLGGTWSNRAFLYTGSSHGVKDTSSFTIPNARTIYDQLDAANVSWGVYSQSGVRQDVLGWTASHPGVDTFTNFLVHLADGTLPHVSYVDPSGAEDEHPVHDIGGGEQWVRRIYEVALASPLWPRLAIFVTYDEGGALFDHVNPPAACLPDSTLTEFDRYGVRVPLYVISPWARPSYVGHVVNSHTSILRFVQLRYGLPALSDRDANSNAMLEYFDFCHPSMMTPPDAPAAFGLSGC
jgi:phospholipase C